MWIAPLASTACAICAVSNEAISLQPGHVAEGVSGTVTRHVRREGGLWTKPGENIARNDACNCTSDRAIVTWHLPVPSHAPAQCEKTMRSLGSCEKTRADPAGNDAEHVPGQAIPGGLDVTVPDPATATVTVRKGGGGAGGGGSGGLAESAATTPEAARGERVQSGPPLHAPA